MTRNQEFGRWAAYVVYKFGFKQCPFILNSEQADAYYKMYNELKHNKHVN